MVCVCARDRGGQECYADYEWAQTGKVPVLRKRLHPAVTSGECAPVGPRRLMIWF